jgi:hypothetical protein
MLALRNPVEPYCTDFFARNYRAIEREVEPEIFENVFQNAFPLFKYISHTAVAIIGGSVTEIYSMISNKRVDIKRARNNNDVNVIFINSTKLEVVQVIKHICNTLEIATEYSNGCTSYAFIPSKNIIRVRYEDIANDVKFTLVFILSIFDNFDKVFDSVDLSCCQICYYPAEKKFITSAIGQDALETSAVLLDPTKYHDRYIHRIKKYFERGFRLILPQIDVDSIKSTRYITFSDSTLILPYEYDRNEIVVKGIHTKVLYNNHDEESEEPEEPEVRSEYINYSDSDPSSESVATSSSSSDTDSSNETPSDTFTLPGLTFMGKQNAIRDNPWSSLGLNKTFSSMLLSLLYDTGIDELKTQVVASSINTLLNRSYDGTEYITSTYKTIEAIFGVTNSKQDLITRQVYSAFLPSLTMPFILEELRTHGLQHVFLTIEKHIEEAKTHAIEKHSSIMQGINTQVVFMRNTFGIEFAPTTTKKLYGKYMTK